MKAKHELWEMLRDANPSPNPGPPRNPDPFAGSLKPERRVRPMGRVVALVGAFVAVAAFGALSLMLRDRAPDLSGLAGTYVGSLVREGGPGDPNVRQFVELEITVAGDTLQGFLTHSPADAISLESAGTATRPVLLELSGDELTLKWDRDLGVMSDGTISRCDWEYWDLAFEVSQDDQSLILRQGVMAGSVEGESPVGEFFTGCPDGEREVLRLVLRRR